MPATRSVTQSQIAGLNARRPSLLAAPLSQDLIVRRRRVGGHDAVVDRSI